MNGETYRFNVGKFECIAINDGTFIYNAGQYFANAPRDDLARALRDHGVDPERIPSPYTCLVVNTGAHQVLIDTGAGALTPNVGRLLQHLRTKGIAPEEIDTVILTHGHPDHIGGNVDAEGNVVFRNARHVMWRDEWEYWTDEANLERVAAQPLGGLIADVARKQLPPIEGRLDLVERETEIVPGIHAIPAPGHTPGQMAVVVVSGDDELLYISDAVIHPIHLEQPDWYPVFDLDPREALATKRRLFDRAAAEQSLVLAFHFDPFPSLGHVVRQGRGWQWQPIETGGRGAAEPDPPPASRPA